MIESINFRLGSVIVAVGSDGNRLVVWGVGVDSESARADAERWAGDEPVDLEFHEVSAERAADVLAGDVAWYADSL